MSDFATVITGTIASTIAISGWLVNSHLQRKHRIFEIRTEKRISMFKDVEETRTTISKNIVDGGGELKADHNLNRDLNRSYKSVLLYGYEDEIEMYKNFIEALEHKDIEKINQTMSCLNLFREKLREELGYPKKYKNKNSEASK